MGNDKRTQVKEFGGYHGRFLSRDEHPSRKMPLLTNDSEEGVRQACGSARLGLGQTYAFPSSSTSPTIPTTMLLPNAKYRLRKNQYEDQLLRRSRDQQCLTSASEWGCMSETGQMKV